MLDDHPLPHECNPICDTASLVHVVGNEHQGHITADQRNSLLYQAAGSGMPIHLSNVVIRVGLPYLKNTFLRGCDAHAPVLLLTDVARILTSETVSIAGKSPNVDRWQHADYIHRMTRTRFGNMLQRARQAKGMSLRQLSAESGIEYTRLSRMEHGTRPAPRLPFMRRLAETLSLDLCDLLVSAGMPREAMEHMLWVERLEQAKRAELLAGYMPQGRRAGLKNEFVVDVVSRDGARCTASLGSETWSFVTFSAAKRLRVMIPPESILVFSDDPHRLLAASYNVFRARICKIRKIGALLNLVLVIGDVELNALVMATEDVALTPHPDEEIYVAISPAAVSTEPQENVKG